MRISVTTVVLANRPRKSREQLKYNFPTVNHLRETKTKKK